jgi:hypothetical protein
MACRVVVAEQVEQMAEALVMAVLGTLEVIVQLRAMLALLHLHLLAEQVVVLVAQELQEFHPILKLQGLVEHILEQRMEQAVFLLEQIQFQQKVPILAMAEILMQELIGMAVLVVQVLL